MIAAVTPKPSAPPLYFVTIAHDFRGVLMAGHWYAADAAAARQIAVRKYIADRKAMVEHGKIEIPVIDACEVKSRRSTSYANALNPESA